MGQVTEQYQVFINHRGEDTKNNLVSFLYQDLTTYGLRVFLDKEELLTGDTLCPAIRGAISSASVHIAVFSENYAHSRWCLDELVWMLRSFHERKFIPVFWDVEPLDLRYIERGRYAEAFHKHQQNGRVSMEVVDGWKAALKEAAEISGLRFKTKESNWAEFVRDIENIVIQEVKWDPIEVAPHPVGLDQVIKDFDDHLQKQSAAKVVGIAGISGIGKSTLAKHIFNLKRSKFSRASYLFNVREEDDLTSLQRHLLRDLLGKDMYIPNVDRGKSLLRRSLNGLKVLIVLDDVDDTDKIKSLLDMDAIESGSLIILTSRDRDVLRGSSSNTLLYDVEPLKRKYAHQLFCRHAFDPSNPCEGYGDLVEQILEICGGVPLCLKVVGEQLARKIDRTHWEQRLKTYSQGWPTELDAVIKTLKWSYEAMGSEEKEMLLDVASFLVGEARELAVGVLEGLGYHDVENCLEILGQKCLLDFHNGVGSQDISVWGGLHDDVVSVWGGLHDDVVSVWGRVVLRCADCLFLQRDHRQFSALQGKDIDISISGGGRSSLRAVFLQRSSKIKMQNQVRELARRMVREDLRTNNPLRLSCSTDVQKMLRLKSGPVSCQIRGICIRQDWSPLPNNIYITGVQLLVVEHPIDDSWFLGSGISGDLVWLRWRISRFISLPSTISLKNLRVLELQSPQDNLEDFFHSINEIPSQLRELNIDAGEEDASSSSSSSAQSVDLQHSTKSLIHGNISTTLQGMVHPYFFRFLQWIGGSLMKNLNKIVLTNVTVLQSLPIDCSELKNLRHLDLSGSTNLTTLPNSFSQLLRLQYLALRDCTNLSITTDILGEISTLEHIDFKGCRRLNYLPQGIAYQRRLRYLNLLHTSLKGLPQNLRKLYVLEQLRIGSANLRELPRSVGYFVHLKELILVRCSRLEDISSTPIEELRSLERLEIYHCHVHILPAGITQLKYMKILTIFHCPIKEFAFHNAMDDLRDFTFVETSITEISIPASACPRLEIVDLSYNFRLRQVQVFPSTVVKLNLESCYMLEDLNISKLVNLKFLDINGCDRVQTVDVESSSSLEEIMAERCWSLMVIQPWSQLQRLNFISFSQDFHSRNQEFEKFMLNSFHNVTMLEVPDTTTSTSVVRLKNVDSHIAILMCFLTTSESTFNIRFEASNSGSGAQSGVYKTARGEEIGNRLGVHMYMWTQGSKLLKDLDDHFYNEVAIYKDGNFNVRARGGERGRGWILTFASEKEALKAFEQIMNLLWRVTW